MAVEKAPDRARGEAFAVLAGQMIRDLDERDVGFARNKGKDFPGSDIGGDMTHQGVADAAKILPAIRHLYDTAIDGNKWPVFLKELAAAFEAKGSQVVRVQPRETMLNFSALYGYDDEILEYYGTNGNSDFKTALARYEQHFIELMPTDPRVRFLERIPGRPLSCWLEISEAELHSSKIYQDMLRLADGEYSLIVSLAEDDGSLSMLGVFRSKESTHFDEDDVATFDEIIPHLKQAIRISEHLARANFASRAALDALDSVAMGIVIVDDGARLVHANATGKRIIELADGISSTTAFSSFTTTIQMPRCARPFAALSQRPVRVPFCRAKPYRSCGLQDASRCRS